MANKRMFSLDVVDTDKFLELPASSQSLYFHLGMRADDDGFVSAPKKIANMVNCSIDDLKLLIAKKYLIPFDNGVVVITDWKVNNYIQKDRYHETRYLDEKAMLSINNNVYNMDTNCIQDVSKSDTQVRLGKDSIDNTISKDIVSSTNVQRIIEKWNELGLQKVKVIKSGTNRYTLLKARLKEYGEDTILEAIENIKDSDFLKGQNKNGWTITFDWFLKPKNFIKVLEGNYKSEKNTVNHGTSNIEDMF